MRARALQAWASRLTDWQVTILQTLETTHALYSFGVGLYNAIQRVLPVAHHVYFQFLERANLHRDAKSMLGTDHFRHQVAQIAPNLVVSTHAHLNHGFFDLVRAELGRDRVRCATYCGELWGGYGFSRHWVNADADAFIGAVQSCRQAALDHGMPDARAHVGGFMLRPEFYAELGGANSRHSVLGEDLDLDPEAFTVLLATGAVGANNHLPLLHCLESRRRRVQAVVLCGDRRTDLDAVSSWGRKAKHVMVRALPRRDDMPRLISAVDLLVARPGTGTTSEAILCGTPVVFNGIGGVMPQEYITVKFARQHGFGAVVYWPHQLARVLDQLQGSPARMDALRVNLAAARPAQQPNDIFDQLNHLVSS